MGKLFDFIVLVAINGFIAIFVSVTFWFILAFVFAFAMIPVSILVGDSIAIGLSAAVDDLGFRVIYAIVFISMMLEDMGMPGIKQTLSKWWRNKKSTQSN